LRENAGEESGEKGGVGEDGTHQKDSNLKFVVILFPIDDRDARMENDEETST